MFFQRKNIIFIASSRLSQGFPGGSVVNNLPANAGAAGDTGSIPGLGRSPERGCGNPLEYSSMERRAWWVTGHGIAKSWT